MNQGNLFSTQADQDGNYSYRPARRNDKQTSKTAAANVDLKGNKKLFFETLAKSAYPMTSREVAEAAIPFEAPLDIGQVLSKRETLRKRAKELVNGNRIKETNPRECRVSGNQATTYEVI